MVNRALNSLRLPAFDIVVTDYRMKRMNGVELIEKIRQMDPDARVILLSGFVEPLGLTEQNTGADAVISKSSNEPAQLVRCVKRLMNRVLRKQPASQKASARGAGGGGAVPHSEPLKSGTLRACGLHHSGCLFRFCSSRWRPHPPDPLPRRERA